MWFVLKSTRISSHFSGFTASVIGHIIAWGVFICLTDISKLVLEGRIENGFVLFISCIWYLDSLGAFFYTTAYTPFSTMKIRLITEPQHQNSIRKYLNCVIREKKVRELYSGYLVGLFYVFEGVLQLGIYEELKKDQGRYFHFFLIGVLAKLIAVSATYPYRVVASILQSRPITLRQSTKMIIKSSGLFGFYKGFIACLSRQLPPAGFIFMLLELLRFLLKSLLHSIPLFN